MQKSNSLLSRRKFIGVTTTAAAAVCLTPLAYSCANSGSKFGNVQIGAITYSWRSMPSTAEDIIKYCTEAGINSLELMGNVAEEFAGIPAMPPRLKRGVKQTDAERESFLIEKNKAMELQKQWRLSNNFEKYKRRKVLSFE